MFAFNIRKTKSDHDYELMNLDESISLNAATKNVLLTMLDLKRPIISYFDFYKFQMVSEFAGVNPSEGFQKIPLVCIKKLLSKDFIKPYLGMTNRNSYYFYGSYYEADIYYVLTPIGAFCAQTWMLDRMLTELGRKKDFKEPCKRLKSTLQDVTIRYMEISESKSSVVTEMEEFCKQNIPKFVLNSVPFLKKSDNGQRNCILDLFSDELLTHLLSADSHGQFTIQPLRSSNIIAYGYPKTIIYDKLGHVFGYRMFKYYGSQLNIRPEQLILLQHGFFNFEMRSGNIIGTMTNTFTSVRNELCREISNIREVDISQTEKERRKYSNEKIIGFFKKFGLIADE